MESERYIFACGTELRLRPVSAMRLIEARREGRKLAEELELSGDDERLAVCACIAAASLYDDDTGEMAFTSGRDALEALSAEEIISASAEYELPERQKRSFSAPMESDSLIPETGERKALSAELRAVYPALSRNRSAGEPGNSLRELSGLLERDCRRYDGGFTLY